MEIFVRFMGVDEARMGVLTRIWHRQMPGVENISRFKGTRSLPLGQAFAVLGDGEELLSYREGCGMRRRGGGSAKSIEEMKKKQE